MRNLADEVRRELQLEEFVEQVGKSLMLVLMSIPYEDWPKEAKIAFNHEKNKAPTAADIYLEKNKRYSSL